MFSLHSRQHKTHLQITCVLISTVENVIIDTYMQYIFELYDILRICIAEHRRE